MKKIILFLKTQYKLLVILLLAAPIPLYFLLNAQLDIPYLPYFFLILLFAVKMLAFQATSTSKSMMNMAKVALEKELKRNPSKQMIINRSQFIHLSRDVALMIAGLGVIFVSIYFKAF